MKEKILKKLQALHFAGENEIPLRSRKSPVATKLKVISEATAFITTKKEVFQKAESIKTNSASDKNREQQLQQVRADIGDCMRCRLCEQRAKIVFGVGNPHAELMFVGEAPGRDEDKQGEPFVGRAGQLLTKIIEAMKLTRDQVYIANVVKCRPPENRNPAPDEIATCEPFLLRQIEIIQPKIIVGLGTFAAQTLLQTENKISGLRGTFIPWPSPLVKANFETALPEGAICLMPTYHPAFLLRNPAMKRVVWEDMQKVMGALGIN